MTHDDIGSCLDGKPPGPDCEGLYPSTIKGCREYFSSDVVGAIHISMHRVSSFDPIPASITPPAERVLGLVARIVDWHRIAIAEAGFAGIALFSDDDCDPNQLGLVAQHRDEARMRDLHKRLVIALAHLDLLLPKRVFPDDEGPDPLSHQHSNDGFRGEMQLMRDATIALVGDGVELMAREALLLGELLLQMFALLIVALVDRLEHTTVNEDGHKTRLV